MRSGLTYAILAILCAVILVAVIIIAVADWAVR